MVVKNYATNGGFFRKSLSEVVMLLVHAATETCRDIRCCKQHRRRRHKSFAIG